MSHARLELEVPHIAQLSFDHAPFHIEGVSVAGVETWLRIPEWHLAIDVGRVPDQQARCKYLALTHAHMDHAGGLGQYLALRQLTRAGHSTVFAPAESCADLLLIIEAWQRLHRVTFDWELLPMRPGDTADIGSGRTLKALPALHVVPALGYAVSAQSNKLKPEFVGLNETALHKLRRQGVQISGPHHRLLLAVSGDTLIGALEKVPELQSAEVVLFEATFLDELRAPARAHVGGHTHLSEWVQRMELFGSQTVVPYHISRIYGVEAAKRALKKALPEEFYQRVKALLPAG